LVLTIAAGDGSWTTASLNPIELGVVKFDKPEMYGSTRKNHPWAKAR
jgi:hypothetical protein